MEKKTIGELMAENFQYAGVFQRKGIDFCCHSDKTLETACAERGLDVADVMAELQNPSEPSGKPNFSAWDLDLVNDYVLKYHHRKFHRHHHDLQALVDKVARVHGDRHPELKQLKAMVDESMAELEMHFQKEETVLFPYLYEMWSAYENGRQPCRSIAAASCLLFAK